MTVAVLRTSIKETHCIHRSASSFIRYILVFEGLRRPCDDSGQEATLLYKDNSQKMMQIPSFEILKSMATMGELTLIAEQREVFQHSP